MCWEFISGFRIFVIFLVLKIWNIRLSWRLSIRDIFWLALTFLSWTFGSSNHQKRIPEGLNLQIHVSVSIPQIGFRLKKFYDKVFPILSYERLPGDFSEIEIFIFFIFYIIYIKIYLHPLIEGADFKYDIYFFKLLVVFNL